MRVARKVHCRLFHDGTLYVLSETDFENGTDWSDINATQEDNGNFREFTISVSATPPPEEDEEGPAIEVNVPDEIPAPTPEPVEVKVTV
jgi:hypothetical protein